MRWWGNPSVFPFCCLFELTYVYVCVFNHTPECVLCQCRQWVGVFVVFMCGYCVWTERSLYSRHVVYSVLSDSLLPASVVYLCRLWEVWLTPHDWPTRNWPDLTGSDHTSRNKPETTGRNQDAGSNHPHWQIKTQPNKHFSVRIRFSDLDSEPCYVLAADLSGVSLSRTSGDRWVTDQSRVSPVTSRSGREARTSEMMWRCRTAPTLASVKSRLKTFLFTTAFHWSNATALNCTVTSILSSLLSLLNFFYLRLLCYFLTC